VCTVIYPGLTLLVLVAVREAQLQEEAKGTLLLLLTWALWPVRLVAEGVPRLVDAMGPQGLDEPASMLLAPWQLWLLSALQIALPISLIFVTWLTLINGIAAVQRLARLGGPSNDERQQTKHG
jgi:hypothetical protein